ncbi:hypothetical protein [Endozoicomonas euniceicola]|uniref:Uncharacterized protein n=1 Tax=Endozoicomonas euniceicola TaxID=1234143 RepID=A0ABY6GWG3_9GAMM|nr:hypothetical protein [Endozoicomonas euniceicola]UYM17112.1 hypothetical protein NX720_04090 [Endozoicomonas euniceicola]
MIEQCECFWSYKVNAIRELQANGIGAVAMGCGSDVALETADAALTHERLPELAGMISLS